MPLVLEEWPDRAMTKHITRKRGLVIAGLIGGTIAAFVFFAERRSSRAAATVGGSSGETGQRSCGWPEKRAGDARSFPCMGRGSGLGRSGSLFHGRSSRSD